MNTQPTLTTVEAYAIASEWGSYVQTDDPGACMYGFKHNDCRPQHERHRAQCLKHIDAVCIPQVLSEFQAAVEFGNERCAHEAIRDYRSLVLLRRFLVSAQCQPDAPKMVWRKPYAIAA